MCTYATTQTFISYIQRKKQLRNFFKLKKLFFNRIAIRKFALFKETFFWICESGFQMRIIVFLGK